ncbi:hypothetical protein ACIQVO_36800 [Streptomyces sp. NPDC101062]|uniref:hypothetical protein n=1 Tax=unclassified Streptomyces TaxID=2593676 RepID=UPI0037FA9690
MQILQPSPVRTIDPAIATAVERQSRALHAQRARAFPDDLRATGDAPAPIQDTLADRRRQADTFHAQALRRARTEQARQPGAAPSVRSDSLRSTA